MKNCYTCIEYGACSIFAYDCTDWRMTAKITPLRINIIGFDMEWKNAHKEKLAGVKLDESLLKDRIESNIILLNNITPEKYIANMEKAMGENPTETLLTVSGT